VIVKTVVLVGLIGMHKSGCSGETRLVLHVPSSSWAGKRFNYYCCYYYYYCLILWNVLQVIGDEDLAAKFEESALTIRRDIIFAASLYI